MCQCRLAGTISYQFSVINSRFQRKMVDLRLSMADLRILIVIHAGFLLLDLLVVDVVIVVHQLVDGAVGREFDDAVGDGLDKLMVVGSKQNVSLELNKVVVESLNRLEVEVVGR